MCTSHHEQSVTVCDVAIDRVRADLAHAFGDQVLFTQEGSGTLVEAGAAENGECFETVVRASITNSQPLR